MRRWLGRRRVTASAGRIAPPFPKHSLRRPNCSFVAVHVSRRRLRPSDRPRAPHRGQRHRQRHLAAGWQAQRPGGADRAGGGGAAQQRAGERTAWQLGRTAATGAGGRLAQCTERWHPQRLGRWGGDAADGAAQPKPKPGGERRFFSRPKTSCSFWHVRLSGGWA